ncbi:MAG: GntP family permease [Bacteroidia bacterium]|nr:GntP family permease [Bacteroidia bacterium]
MPDFPLLWLFLSIGLMVWMTARWKLDAFFVLLLAALVLGMASGIDPVSLTGALKNGFGETMKKIGLIILLGTVLGVILAETGATLSMAQALLRRIHTRRAPAALSAMGFLVGLPIFCDAGYIILSGLCRSLVTRTGAALPVMAVCLATGLYSVHCLIPPHPGISAAVAETGADLGLVMLAGILVSIPGTLAGYYWAMRQTRLFPTDTAVTESHTNDPTPSLPAPWRAFVPVLLHILLIGMQSLLSLRVPPDAPPALLYHVSTLLGEPVMALLVAIAVALVLLAPRNQPDTVRHWLSDGLRQAGPVLAIVGAGGAFGGVLKLLHPETLIEAALTQGPLGIFLPFLVAVLLKTAQGSSTVAVITTASLITPVLGTLGLGTPWLLTLATLAMGAGSMMVSHANDAFFWVIAHFSPLDSRTLYRIYTPATVIMALVSMGVIWILSLFPVG